MRELNERRTELGIEGRGIGGPGHPSRLIISEPVPYIRHPIVVRRVVASRREIEAEAEPELLDL